MMAYTGTYREIIIGWMGGSSRSFHDISQKRALIRQPDRRRNSRMRDWKCLWERNRVNDGRQRRVSQPSRRSTESMRVLGFFLRKLQMFYISLHLLT